MSKILEQLQEILKEEGIISNVNYEVNFGAAVHFEEPEKTDAEKIAETPINIDPLGVHDLKNVERIIKL